MPEKSGTSLIFCGRVLYAHSAISSKAFNTIGVGALQKTLSILIRSIRHRSFCQ